VPPNAEKVAWARASHISQQLQRCLDVLAEGAPLAAVAGRLGDTVGTVSRTYIYWPRDDRDVPAVVLDRVLAPAPDGVDLEGQPDALSTG
jgi:hypothetical protein